MSGHSFYRTRTLKFRPLKNKIPLKRTFFAQRFRDLEKNEEVTDDAEDDEDVEDENDVEVLQSLQKLKRFAKNDYTAFKKLKSFEAHFENEHLKEKASKVFQTKISTFFNKL